MNWIFTYAAILLLVDRILYSDKILLVVIYMQVKIYMLTLPVTYAANQLITIRDDIVYKLSDVVSQSTMEIWVISFISLQLLIYCVGTTHKHYGKRETYVHTYALICMWVIISYIQHLDSVTNHIDGSVTNPLYINCLVAIHPVVLVAATVAITMHYNDASIRACNKHGVNMIGTDAIHTYYMLLTAILLGGAWASAIFGWGGFWVWDPIEVIILTHLYIIVNSIHYGLNILSVAAYSIWYVLYAKTNVIGGIHSFNIFNWINFDENIVLWTNMLCMVTYICIVERRRHRSSWVWMAYIPIVIIVVNNVNEQLCVRDVIYIPTNMINLLSSCTIVYYVSRKYRIDNIGWVSNVDVTYTYVYAVRVATMHIAGRINIWFTMIPTITICLLAMRGRERLTYIKDHAQICVLLVTITIYAICYTTYDVPYIADSIDVVDAHALVVYSVERVRDVSVDVDVLHVGIDARSYYYMVVLDKQYNAHVFMDWLDKRNSLYSVENNVILGRNICASHMSMRHRIVNMVTVIIIWELVKRRTLVRIP